MKEAGGRWKKRREEYNETLSRWRERDECGQFPTLFRLAELFLLPFLQRPLLQRGFGIGHLKSKMSFR